MPVQYRVVVRNVVIAGRAHARQNLTLEVRALRIMIAMATRRALAGVAARSHSLNTTGRRRRGIILPVMTSTPTAQPVAMTARFKTLLVE